MNNQDFPFRVFVPTSTITCMALAAVCAAQHVAPASHAKKEGDWLTALNVFGGLAGGRTQLAEGGIRTPLVIRRLGFRLDAGKTQVPGTARSWTRVSIDVGSVNMATISHLFARNLSQTAVRTFDAKFSLPAATKPKTSPAPWNQAFSFAFQKPYLADGKSGVLFNFLFRGGTLANKKGWTHATYPFDAHRDGVQTYNRNKPTHYPPIAKLTCSDASPFVKAQSYGESRAFADLAGNGALRNKTETVMVSLATARSNKVVHAIGLAGVTAGVQIGAACNRLHLDFRNLTLLFSRFTSDNGGATAETRASFTNNPAFVGQSIWTQAAWVHATTKRFSLTGASMHRLPAPPPGAVDRTIVYALFGHPSAGTLVRPGDDAHRLHGIFPVTRYDTK